MLTGPEHVFEFVNDAYIRLAGQREFLGRTVRQVFSELDNQELFERLDGVFASGERFIANRIPVMLQTSPDAPGRSRAERK